VAKDKQLDIVRDLVLGLIPKLDRRKKIEDLAGDVGKMYRVIFREVRDVEYEEFAPLVMPPVAEARKRAKPYLLSLREGTEGQGDGRVAKIQRRIKGKKPVTKSGGLRVASQGLDRRS